MMVTSKLSSTVRDGVKMPDFRSLSTRSRKLLPVIHAHANDRDHALRNATVALENGADGVFLISHHFGLDHRGLAGHCDLVKGELGSDAWVGVNFLDLPRPLDALEYARTTIVDGLWVDNAGLMSQRLGQTEAEVMSAGLTELGDDAPVYFGGVAFKYQPDEGDPAQLAALAANHMDVVTTSGPGTGEPVEVEKVRRMRASMLGRPLALASGVTAANVGSVLPYVSFFLVASSLRVGDTEPDELDPAKVRDMANVIHDWSG